MTHESRIYKIADTISDLNYFDNIILLGINNGKLEKKEPFKKNISIYRLDMQETQWLKTGFFIKSLNVIRLTLNTFNFLNKIKPTVVHAHNLASLPVCVLYKFYNKKTKIVYDTHEIEARRNGWSSTIQFIAKKVEALLIKFCEVTVVVNDKFQEIYKKWYNVEAVRIFNTPFYNKLDANNYLREKFSINNKTPIFAYVGVLDDSRGVDHYLDFALKTNIDVCFVFIGRILKNEKRIKSIADRSNKIYLHDAVDVDQLYYILRSADYSLQALHLREAIAMNNLLGLGNKFFESAMAGLPMIGGGFEVQSNFISKYNLGVVIDYGNEYESITSAVKKIIKLDHSQLQKNCFDFFTKYNWDNESKKIKEYYYNFLI